MGMPDDVGIVDTMIGFPHDGHGGRLRLHHPPDQGHASPRRSSSSRPSTCSRTCPRRSCRGPVDPVAVTLGRDGPLGRRAGPHRRGRARRHRGRGARGATPTGSSPRCRSTPTTAWTGIRAMVAGLRDLGHPGRRGLPVGHLPPGGHQRQEDVPDLRQVRGAGHPRLLLRRACPGPGSGTPPRTSSSSTRSCSTSPTWSS